MIDLARQPLVETSWLAEHLDDPDLRIVDARWRGDGSSCRLYRSGHVPGAVHLNWHLDLSHTASGVRDLVLPAEWFAMTMRAVGIGDDTRVVAYADYDYSGAARLWWVLRYYGHDQVAVLNGGITKWKAEGRPLSLDVPVLNPVQFTPRVQPHLRATAAEIEQVIGDPQSNVHVVDTRPMEQYAGDAVWTPRGSLYLPPGQDWVELDGRIMRGGHIPGAIHLHASRNFDPNDWTFLPAGQLRAMAQAAGVEPEQRVITYCGVGISASAGLFALHLAGYRNVALYDGSWEEWGTDPSKPIERSVPGS